MVKGSVCCRSATQGWGCLDQLFPSAEVVNCTRVRNFQLSLESSSLGSGCQINLSVVRYRSEMFVDVWWV